MHPCAYRLPHDVRDRLTTALKPLRNKDACMALATFIGRFWTAPKRLGLPFMLDRRALAPLDALGLTEARIRGAIKALERVGFLERMPISGRTHQRTPEGLHRKPVAFLFGPDYRDAFSMANKRAQAARDRRSRGSRPHQTLANPSRPSTTAPAARPTNSPKYKASEAERMNLGEKRKAPTPSESNLALEDALDRWRRAAEKAGAIKGRA